MILRKMLTNRFDKLPIYRIILQSNENDPIGMVYNVYKLISIPEGIPPYDLWQAI